MASQVLHSPVAGAAVGGVVLEQFPHGAMMLEDLADEQREGGFGGLEFVALVLEVLDPLEDFVDLGRSLFEVESERGGLCEDVALAGHVRDDDVLAVADLRGVDVLIGARELLHGMHVQAALVGEGRGADERGADVMDDVRHFIDEERKLAQLREIATRRGCRALAGDWG